MKKTHFTLLWALSAVFVFASCDGGVSHQTSNTSYGSYNTGSYGSSSGSSSSTNNIHMNGNNITYGSRPASQEVDFDELMRQLERSQNSAHVRQNRQSRPFSPDDAYDEGHDNGYMQGYDDGRHGRSRGYGYDESNTYYNHYATMYEDGYDEGYDDGYDDGYSRYEEDNDD